MSKCELPHKYLTSPTLDPASFFVIASLRFVLYPKTKNRFHPTRAAEGRGGRLLPFEKLPISLSCKDRTVARRMYYKGFCFSSISTSLTAFAAVSYREIPLIFTFGHP